MSRNVYTYVTERDCMLLCMNITLRVSALHVTHLWLTPFLCILIVLRIIIIGKVYECNANPNYAYNFKRNPTRVNVLIKEYIKCGVLKTTRLTFIISPTRKNTTCNTYVRKLYITFFCVACICYVCVISTGKVHACCAMATGVVKLRAV